MQGHVAPLDRKPGSFIEPHGSQVVFLGADAKAVDLDAAQITTMREEAWVVLQEKMRRTREREAQMAEEESDDEIVFSDEEDD